MKYQIKLLNGYMKEITHILNSSSLNKVQKISVINGLVKVLTNEVQSKITTDLFIEGDSYIPPFYSGEFPFTRMCKKCYTFFDDIITYSNSSFPVQLASVPIISPIWSLEKLTKTLATIGSDLNTPFKYNENNHFDLAYLKPLGLYWNGNGLHSANTGFLKGEGILYTSSIIDFSNVYDHFYFDGTFYICSNCDHIILKPEYYQLGIIFEIGRILSRNSIDLSNIEVNSTPINEI